MQNQDPTQRDRNARDIFLRALGIQPPEAQAAFIEGACLQDECLRSRVEALLKSHKQDSFLESAAVNENLTSKGETPVSEGLGTVIGRYKLLQKIGEGGMGVVYMAEQMEPVTRKVALKIIKLGMDTRNVVARFEAERQALALMDHPNIARVLDGGATESGRPYFVMELVRGVPITEYCDKNHLPTGQRLDLFMQVCQAVQHAHQKGVIHRDLKPSNILVTLNDGVPLPMVIDFGIAKATSQKLTEKTLFTNYAQMIGTPAYMSPEQAEMSKLDVDTRTDIYSLGVLLYELLTGTTPFAAKELLSLGYGEMQRVIAQQEPLRPSTRLSTMANEERTAVARNRSIEASALDKTFRGDLDWIVMKCLEKDRARRYETANGLAADLKRHLKNEPVVARPPSAAYRFQKAFRRNKLVFMAIAAVAAALLAGLCLAAIGLRQAVKERNMALVARAAAESERRKAQSAQEKAERATTAEAALREQAQHQAQAALDRVYAVYAADIRQAQQAIASHDLHQARVLLDRHRPNPGERDLRGWEWRFLWGQIHRDEPEPIASSPTSAGINSLGPSFSGDGHLVACGYGSPFGKLVVTETSSHRTVFERTNAWFATFANRNNWLVFEEDLRPTNVALVLLDLAERKETRLAMVPPAPWSWIGVSADDRIVVGVRHRPGDKESQPTRILAAWEIATGRQLWEREIESGGGTYALSPDSQSVAATWNREEKVQIFALADGAPRQSIATPDASLPMLRFSPDSAQILTGGGSAANTIRIWDVQTGAFAGQLQGHRNVIFDLCFTRDGKQLISASADFTIRFWDWPSGKEIRALSSSHGAPTKLAVAPGGGALAACSVVFGYPNLSSIQIWNLDRLRTNDSHRLQVGRISSTRNNCLPAFAGDSRSLIGLDGEGTLTEWEVNSLAPVRRWQLLSPTDRQFEVHISGQTRQVIAHQRSGEIRLLDLSSGLLRTNFLGDAPYYRIGFGGNGRFLQTLQQGANEGPTQPDAPVQRTNQVWNARTWGIIGSFNYSHLLRSPRNGPIFSDRSGNTFTADQVGKLLVWNCEKPEAPPKTLALPDRLDSDSPFIAFDASPDGRLAVAGQESGAISLWNLENTAFLRTIVGLGSPVVFLALSPDGARLAAKPLMSDLRLWNVESGEELLTLAGQGNTTDAFFSPDGRVLAEMNSTGTIEFWSAPSWQEIAAAEARPENRDPLPANSPKPYSRP